VWTETGEGLLIDPVPPAELGEVSVVRVWRGVPVRVRFNAREFGQGPCRLVVGGRSFAGCVLPSSLVAGAQGREVGVEVKWGALAPGFTEAKAAAPGRVS
jgi:cellobiose phosphorylase